MTPTPRLRYIIRQGKPDPFFINAMTGQHHVPTVTVLQQWWEPTYEEWLNIKEGKWLDVPLEEEK